MIFCFSVSLSIATLLVVSSTMGFCKLSTFILASGLLFFLSNGTPLKELDDTTLQKLVSKLWNLKYRFYKLFVKVHPIDLFSKATILRFSLSVSSLIVGSLDMNYINIYWEFDSGVKRKYFFIRLYIMWKMRFKKQWTALLRQLLQKFFKNNYKKI